MNTDISSYIDQIVNMAVQYAPQVIGAILALIIGLWIIGKITKFLNAALSRTGMEITLTKFLSSLASIGMKIMLLLSVAQMFGISTTSFVAIFGALMVGVGMALNGSIGHTASGVMLMIFKPFKVGDLIEIGGGHLGTVEAINAFNTTLVTLDNRRIIVANGNVTGNTITNISGQGTTGVELTFGIGYNDSIDKARMIILEVGHQCPWILDDPAQVVVVEELADSSVNLATRPFCKSEHFWDAKFYMLENVKKEFDKKGISIPYPQMDIHQISSN
ncbi:MAG: mechanosensitive ion channel family protein [Saprospiraceae bacterium]|nr:mechanosensitive ion channel family protein [Saprospiraceae bacterium]|tara:strand:+ start:312 stop:1136 length:825 start_codon:yes stop_codon:yes gene_type:complete